MGDTHDDVSKFCEQGSLQWFREEICDHVSGGTMQQINFCLCLLSNGQTTDLKNEGYVNDHVESDGPIHILPIDVEGFDGDVLLGAGDKVLNRVECLEFEYNWMGSWGKQHLYDMVEKLDDKDFTCYQAGKRRLWRITGCWMLYFDVHMWSNVACVNRRRVPKLVFKMENVFQQTLQEEMPIPAHSSEHEILSIDPATMASQYLSTAKK